MSTLFRHISKYYSNNPDFPDILREIPSPPAVVHIVGTLPKDAPYVAIVGTRKPSSYGQQVTYLFARELAKAGVVFAAVKPASAAGVGVRLAGSAVYPPNRIEIVSAPAAGVVQAVLVNSLENVKAMQALSALWLTTCISVAHWVNTQWAPSKAKQSLWLMTALLTAKA